MALDASWRSRGVPVLGQKAVCGPRSKGETLSQQLADEVQARFAGGTLQP